jgi:putative nucleotide binding protein
MGDEDNEQGTPAVVLDHFPRGRPDDERPAYRRSPVVQALGTVDFGLYEATLDEEADVAIGDRIDLEAPSVGRVRELEYEELSGGSQSELEYAVGSVIEAEEQRFVDHFNEAQPITLRLHQLNLLPGIGKKLRNAILEERKRRPFESFGDLEERVNGLHDSEEILIERVVEEISEEELKYRSFVGHEREE